MQKKTGGTPFFADQFTEDLVEEGLRPHDAGRAPRSRDRTQGVASAVRLSAGYIRAAKNDFQAHRIMRLLALVRIDIPVIASTNRGLQAASIGAGTFRDDLDDRLNIFPIDVPPL